LGEKDFREKGELSDRKQTKRGKQFTTKGAEDTEIKIMFLAKTGRRERDEG
jgi:hypothetical protein